MELEDRITLKDKVYKIIQSIPKGKVATYGQIAAWVGKPKAARAVGNILHQNPLLVQIPCHRVVDRQGHLAWKFAFGGLAGQKRLLESEGVKVVGCKVDLSQSLSSDL